MTPFSSVSIAAFQQVNVNWEFKFYHYIIRTTAAIITTVFFNSYNSLRRVLTLSWWRSQSYRNLSIDLLCKLMDWFLYDRDLRHISVLRDLYYDQLWQMRIEMLMNCQKTESIWLVMHYLENLTDPKKSLRCIFGGVFTTVPNICTTRELFRENNTRCKIFKVCLTILRHASEFRDLYFSLSDCDSYHHSYCFWNCIVFNRAKESNQIRNFKHKYPIILTHSSREWKL